MKPGRELPYLKALTLIRPYSDAIVDGHKPVENRGWMPPPDLIGIHFAIHGGRKYQGHFGWPNGWIEPDYSAIGIVGIVRLAGVLDLRGVRRVHLPRVGEPLTDAELAKLHALDRDPWWAGPCGWFVTEARRIETVDVKGALGMWTVPQNEAARVRERWKAARAA